VAGVAVADVAAAVEPGKVAVAERAVAKAGAADARVEKESRVIARADVEMAVASSSRT
jgi:hypothetical protein